MNARDLCTTAHQKSWMAGSASLMKTSGVFPEMSKLNAAPAPPANGSETVRSCRSFKSRILLSSPAIADLPPGYRKGLAVFIPTPPTPLAQFREPLEPQCPQSLPLLGPRYEIFHEAEGEAILHSPIQVTARAQDQWRSLGAYQRPEL